MLIKLYVALHSALNAQVFESILEVALGRVGRPFLAFVALQRLFCIVYKKLFMGNILHSNMGSSFKYSPITHTHTRVYLHGLVNDWIPSSYTCICKHSFFHASLFLKNLDIFVSAGEHRRSNSCRRFSSAFRLRSRKSRRVNPHGLAVLGHKAGV